MESPLIVNGAEIYRAGGGVKIAKSNEKYKRLSKISIFMQDRLK
jgi:hypothetical protein